MAGERREGAGERGEMVYTREQKRAILHEKLQVLRSVTHSHAVNFILSSDRD
jgi:hypothetical protein